MHPFVVHTEWTFICKMKVTKRTLDIIHIFMNFFNVNFECCFTCNKSVSNSSAIGSLIFIILVKEDIPDATFNLNSFVWDVGPSAETRTPICSKPDHRIFMIKWICFYYFIEQLRATIWSLILGHRRGLWFLVWPDLDARENCCVVVRLGFGWDGVVVRESLYVSSG